MIEVEKKFLLSKEEQARLLDGAVLIAEKTLEDTYYDNPNWSVTKRDWWLRSRNGVFELKVPLAGTSSKLNQYHELTTDKEIAVKLELSTEILLADALSQADITPFVTCISNRQSYTKEGFTIDVDVVSYVGDDFTYAVAEIELLVTDEAEVKSAGDRIFAFAKKQNIMPSDRVNGKIAEFLYQRRREHYDALVASGVLG